MKKIIKSSGSSLVKLKNFWFALQLLIVSVSLPVLCFVQLSYKVNSGNSKQTDKAINSSVKLNPVATSQRVLNTITLQT
ncbi:MAG: hypothetical protein ABI472_07630 [Ginsengibacter sp.]